MGKFPLGSVLSAGSSLIGSVIGGIDAAKSRQWQTREREASQRYNTSEREASQLYNTSERKSSQAFQTSEREAQNAFSEYMYNQYSSPQALAAQYSRSGLNPRLAMGGSSVGNATAGSGSSGGAPSGSAPSGTHVGTPSAPITFGQGFQDVAASFSALAQAKKAGVDAKLVEDTAQDIAEGYKLDNAGKKLVNSINTVDLSVKQQTALRQALATLTSTEADADKKRKEIDILVQQGVIARKEAENWDEEFVNRQSNIKSQTAVNESTVSVNDTVKSLNKSFEILNGQKALSEISHRDLMESERLINGVLHRIYSQEAYIGENTKNNRVSLSDLQQKQLEQGIELLKQQYIHAVKNNQWDTVERISSILGNIGSLGLGVAGLGKVFMSSSSTRVTGFR